MIRNRHNYFALGAFMVGAAIILGAMGAHGLEKKLSAHYLATWKTASEYLMYNALGFMAFASYKTNHRSHEFNPDDESAEYSKRLRLKFYVLAAIAGVFLFSSSLYLVALNELFGKGLVKFGIIAPIGGILMTLGWVGIGFHFLTHKHPK